MADAAETRTLRDSLTDRIQDLRGRLRMAEVEYLETCGWRETSSTPDCVWMWQKEIDGKVYSVSRARALQLEGVHRG